MIGPQLQLWDEQQVCAGCAPQKVTRWVRRDRADRTRILLQVRYFSWDCGQSCGCTAPPNRLFNLRGLGSAPLTVENRAVTLWIHGLGTDFSWKRLCQEVVTRLTSFIAFAGTFPTLLDFWFSIWFSVLTNVQHR